MADFNHDGTNKDINMMEAKSEETEQFSSGNTDDSLVMRYKLKASSTDFNCRVLDKSIPHGEDLWSAGTGSARVLYLIINLLQTQGSL